MILVVPRHPDGVLPGSATLRGTRAATKLISCYISSGFVNFHFNFASVVVWRGGDGAPLALSRPLVKTKKDGQANRER